MPEIGDIQGFVKGLVESVAYLGLTGFGFYAAKEILVAVFSLF